MIFTLTLTTFSCANLIDALKDAFPPPGKAGEDIQNENPTEPNKPSTDGNENIPAEFYESKICTQLSSSIAHYMIHCTQQKNEKI
ncbi:MAG: hypothetical protein II232_04720, partial [Spirochaetaceae bacterium]|nr:hypothetical protein [Spirochaetaceae bacterium]